MSNFLKFSKNWNFLNRAHLHFSRFFTISAPIFPIFPQFSAISLADKYSMTPFLAFSPAHKLFIIQEKKKEKTLFSCLFPSNFRSSSSTFSYFFAISGSAEYSCKTRNTKEPKKKIKCSFDGLSNGTNALKRERERFFFLKKNRFIC